MVRILFPFLHGSDGHQRCDEQAQTDEGQGPVEGGEEHRMAGIIPWDIPRQQAGQALFEGDTQQFFHQNDPLVAMICVIARLRMQALETTIPASCNV